MGFHTFDVDRADHLEDPSRYRYCSREELVSLCDLDGDGVVADLGSGTGFYTDDVAPFAARVYAVDVQSEMHEHYDEKGLPGVVETVTAGVADLPFDDDAIDVAYSTFTYHEYATADALAELARVVRPGGRLVTVDWSADGGQESGPPVSERFSLDQAREHYREAGFEVVHADQRPETFTLVGVR